MNSSSFLNADGTIAPRPRAWWSDWLPTLNQVQQAIQLQFGAEPSAQSDREPTLPATETSNDVWAISMRQGLGLVVVAALLAGLIPFLVNAVTAMRLGTALPLAQLAQQAQEQSVAGDPLGLWGETWQMVAGLQPAVFPGWLAGLLTSIGAWINWPLSWLTWWLVYGTVVLLAAKIWGAPTTLQRFLALTSYAAVPMVLTGLGPIPCLGILAQIVAGIWMLAVYITSVRAVTGLDWGRTVLAVVIPGAAILLLGFIALLASAITVLQAIF